MFVRNLLFSCASCLNGHRPRDCKHEDRPLYALKNKGRPSAGTNSAERTPDLLRLDEASLDSFYASIEKDPVMKKMYFHEAPPEKKPRKPTAANQKSATKKNKTPVDIYDGQLSPDEFMRWMEFCGFHPASVGPTVSPTSSSEESFSSTADTSASTSSTATSEDIVQPFDFSTLQFDFPEAIADMPMDYVLEPPAPLSPADPTSADQNIVVAPDLTSNLTRWDMLFQQDFQILSPDITVPTPCETEGATLDPSAFVTTTSAGDEYEPLFVDLGDMDEILSFDDPLADAEVAGAWGV
jgi:hypothetical protein